MQEILLKQAQELLEQKKQDKFIKEYNKTELTLH